LIKVRTRKAKITAFLSLAAFAFGILFFLLRGPYLSNSIKRIIIPVFENATRERVLIDKAVINLFPFYLQAKGFKVFDKNGNRLLWITKARAYIDLTGLLSKEIRIRKLMLKEPDLTIGEADVNRIMDNIRKSSSPGGEGGYRVSLKNVQLTDGNIKYTDAKGSFGISGSGLFLDMVSNNNSSTINVSLRDAALKLPRGSDISGGFDGKIRLENRRISVTEINVRSSRSSLHVKGEALLAPDGGIKGGRFYTKARIYASVLNRAFGLKQERDGVLSLDGSIDLAGGEGSRLPRFTFDLNTKGRFYLETLMEILQVNENIKGALSLDGKITGTLPDVRGSGTVRLRNAVFDTLAVDNLAGKIMYKKKKFALNSFTAQAYGGTLRGDAYILIPHGDFSVAGSVSGVDSPEFFRFIKWDSPFPPGKIKGTFQVDHASGRDMSVTADITYRNTSVNKKGDVLARLETADSAIELRGDVLTLRDTVLSTSLSDLVMDGIIDFRQNTLALNLRVQSRDVSDLTAPYYSDIVAPVSFSGLMKGPMDDPEISGRLEAGAGTVRGVNFESAFADLRYGIKLLSVEQLEVRQEKAVYDISGKVRFRKAEGLFSFNDPFFSVNASVQEAPLEPLVKAAYRAIPVSGTVSGLLSFEGDTDKYSGSTELTVSDAVVYGRRLDKVTVEAALEPEKIRFQSLEAYRGESRLAANGDLFFNGKINVSASLSRIQLRDIVTPADYPVDAVFSMDLKGGGTIDRPDVKFSVDIDEIAFRKIKMNKGRITGRLTGRRLDAEGALAGGLITADATASLSGGMPWSADIRLKKGRYDFLLTEFLDEVPEDLLLSLEGNIRLKGQGSKVSVYSEFTSAGLSLYGYNFRNTRDIVLELVDDEFRVKSFSMNGSGADLSASGSLRINEGYDLKLTGDMDIAPLKVLTDRLASLKGRSDFRIGIAGSWDHPELTGEININEATAALKDFVYKIGPVNGTIFLKKDRFVFDSVKAAFAGGTITFSGAGYLDRKSLQRLFVSAVLNGITIRPMEGVSALFDGRLFYETSAKASSLTGTIDIKKARYRKDVEFTSWLPGMEQVAEAPVEYPAFLAGMELNIRIQGPANILIDNNIAKAPVKIDVNLTGTVAEHGLIGTIEADEGSIYFRGNEFKVLEGSSVEFVEANRIVPVFHLLAETSVRDYYIKLNLDGTIDRFDLSLFSDPPLSEEDILSLLTFGQVKREARGFESGLLASEAASLLTGNIQGEVTENFKYITGLERFEIEPHTTATGAFSPKITVGKQLLDDKLSVIYSTSIGTTEEPVIKLKYSLGRNISVSASKNEIGSVGADLKYRFEFK